MSVPSSPEISLATQAEEQQCKCIYSLHSAFVNACPARSLQEHLQAEVQARTGFVIRDFQLKAVLAILAGRDVVVHAGTGAGKTLIFAAPHFVRPNKVSVIISPLILLQQDQVGTPCYGDIFLLISFCMFQRERMKKLGLKAIAINKEVHLDPADWDVSYHNRSYYIS